MREHRSGLESAIEKIKDSAEFRHDQRELMRVFGGKVDGQVDTSRSGKALAQLERDFSNTTAESALAQVAQAEAQALWQGSKATLDNWESALRAQGAAAARALAEIPDAGVFDNQGFNPGSADIEIDHGKYSTRAMTP